MGRKYRKNDFEVWLERRFLTKKVCKSISKQNKYTLCKDDDTCDKIDITIRMIREAFNDSTKRKVFSFSVVVCCYRQKKQNQFKKHCHWTQGK